MIVRRLRFSDLVSRGVVRTRGTLQNWIRHRGFPTGQMTGPNSRTWAESEIEAYLEQQPTGPKPALPARRPRGRPRKIRIEENITT
jgi:predicted DNA-binding transcriptional regulator AlpA